MALNRPPSGEMDIPIESRVARIEARSTKIEEAVNRIEAVVDRLAEKISAGQRPNYQLIGLVIVIVGAFFAYIKEENTETRTAVTMLQADSRSNEYGRGVTDTVRQYVSKELDTLGKRDEELDVRLQREMRDLDAAHDVKLDAMDRRLQTEIVNAAQERRERENSLRASIDAINENQQVDTATHAQLLARVGYIEDRLRELARTSVENGRQAIIDSGQDTRITGLEDDLRQMTMLIRERWVGGGS